MGGAAADEIAALRAHNDALQRQLALKDQGLERLRQKVHERALLLSHQHEPVYEESAAIEAAADDATKGDHQELFGAEREWLRPSARLLEKRRA